MEVMKQSEADAIAQAKSEIAQEAERRQIKMTQRPHQVSFASGEAAHRAAERGLRWLKKHPGATIKDAPAHMVEKLRLAQQLMAAN